MNAKPKKALVNGRHRTVPIPDTIQAVPKYPGKLVIFRIAASPFYWARYYDSGRIFKCSTKTENKADALKGAIAFYEKLLVRKSGGLAIGKNSRFEVCATEMLKLQEARIKRGELNTRINYEEKSRLRKHMLPFFRAYEVGNIDYFTIESYLNTLTDAGLKVATLQLHASLLRKVLKHAHRKQIIPHLPAFPTLTLQDDPRGYFNSAQYSKLYNKAKSLIGEDLVQRDAKDLVQRHVRITEELYNLILFMVNTFVRPTDIKILQNKHVEIVRKPHLFLRLVHQGTKKHSQPMVSMPIAVKIFEGQLKYQKQRNYGKPDDYVFMPENQNREYALVQLRRQFAYLLDTTKLKRDAKGTERTLYSLRHTAIMFRLTNAENLDMFTLARNARTSVEMIQRFYGSHLHGEMNVEKLQSRKATRITNTAGK